MALIPLQTDIEKALTDFIRSEINSNSYGINFSLGFWVNTTDREGKNVEMIEVPNIPYATEEGLIVPMAIDAYSGNITNLEGIFNADYTIPLSFQINVEDEDHFENTINAINEFKNNLRGQIKRLSVSHNNVTEVFTAVTATDNLTPEGNLTIMMGDTYAFASLNLAFDISKDINYGNQVWVYLSEFDETTGQTLPNGNFTDFQRIFALSPSFNRSNTPEAFQNFESKDVVHIIRETSYTFSLQMFVKDDDFHWNLLENVINQSILNKPYKLRLEFKNFNQSNELVNKFVFEEPVVIIDAEPSFSIGEPQSLELSFGKYFLATEIDITDPTIPVLPKRSSPELVGTPTSTFVNPTQDPDVQGVYATVQFKNTDSVTSNIRVCIGSQCVTANNVEEDETRTFVFNGLFHSTEYVFNAVALSTDPAFANSDPTQELFTTLPIPASFLQANEIVTNTFTPISTGFPFDVENPYDFPVEVRIGSIAQFQEISAPFLVNANTQAQFTYVNNNLNKDNNNEFFFRFSTLSTYGQIEQFTDDIFELFIPDVPTASQPQILNISQPFDDTVSQVTFSVKNTYNKPVTIRATITNNPNLTSFNEFQTLNVPSTGQTGDTVTYTKQFTSDFGATRFILAQAFSTGEEDSTIASQTIVIQQLRTNPLTVAWTPVSTTNKLRYVFTNNRGYNVGYFGQLLLNDVVVPNSSFNIPVGSNMQVPANSFIVAEFENGKIFFNSVQVTATNLQLTGSSSTDEYKLLITTVSTNRTNSLQSSTAGYLARPTVYPVIVDQVETSTNTQSFINFKLKNDEAFGMVTRYGIGTSSTPPPLNELTQLTISTPGGTSVELINEVQNVSAFQYIYLQSQGVATAPHLLPNTAIAIGPITPAPLTETYTVTFFDFDLANIIKTSVVDQGALLQSGDFPSAQEIPTQNGYTSTSWINQATGTTLSIGTQVNSDIIAVRNWSLINYTIQYALDGGTNSPNNPSTYTVEDSVTFEPATKTGHTFEGWFTENTFQNQITSITVGTIGNLQLFAKFEQITLEDVVFTFDTTLDSITITATNPASNPRQSTDNVSTFVDFGVKRSSDGQVVSSRLAREFGVGQEDEITVTLTGLDMGTEYIVFGNGTINGDTDGIRTFTQATGFVESVQPAISVSTVTPVGDKLLRVRMAAFGATTNATVSWTLNSVSQGSVTVNNSTFTTLSSTLFDTDTITLTAPITYLGLNLQGFLVNGTFQSAIGQTVTAQVGTGLDIEPQYF